MNEIKDRNGNFITVVHDSEYGLLQSVTDTLGRVITVQYDSEFYPVTIKQDWKTNNGGVGGSTVQHTYATFSYTFTPIDPNFATGIEVFGPSSGTNIKVLQQITYPAGNSTTFQYNNYGQVWKIRDVAADSSAHELNSVWTDIGETLTAGQSDCPRFSTTYNKIENFNNNQETVVHNSFAVNQTFTGGGGAVGAADLVEVWMENAPHNTKSKVWYHTAGNWTEGLPFGTEDLAQNIQQRWTRTVWKQDDETQIYKINPRVAESRVGDASNTKKTTVDYYLQAGSTTASRFGLVSEVKVYDTDQTTVLKRATTDYNWDNSYLARRIIGLPSEQKLYDGTGNLMSKVTYAYDADPDGFTGTEQNISSVIQHDNTNYGGSFITGRGNLTSTTRHDVLNASTVSSSVKYNTAGGVVSQIDPLGREVKISYADSFNDTTTSRNTYAYPTKLTDPADNFSTVKYRYDTGANVWAQSPAPQNQSQGKTTERIFDSIGRLERQKIVNSGAYTRYEYGSDSNQFKTFSTVTDGAGEVVSESWTDGAGRVRQSRTEHPGSAGGWSGSLVEYDILGRVKRSTVPTEMNGSWNPAGDDNRGNDAQGNPIWQWQAQEYDWKSRVTREINVDGTDRLIFYAGCGCSGNQVVTVQSESVPRDDQPTVNARRTQKIYADALGRNWKTENLNWDAGVYTTTVNTFNGRDQITNTRQYAGTDDPNNTYQDASVTYDGHGRIKTRHYPIEDAGANTTWYYNADDSVQQVVDPRGATTNFTYNDARGLLTNVTYSSPNTTQIPDAPSVSFGYDAVGNRITMTDGTGTAGYAYDSLSRLTSETKTLTGLTGNFTIAYGYHIGGGLKSITDPFSSTVNYANDKTGRLTSVSGTPFGNNTSGNYADGIQYRAFGAIKQMNYKTDDNALVSMQYDSRLRVSDYQVASAAVTGGFVQKSSFEYFADSRPKAVDNALDAGFDRTFKYDFDGRLSSNQFGISTRPDGQQFTTYSQTIAYDAFSNMTSRQTGIWSGAESFTAAYTNGRRQAASGESLVFDALGNIVDITYTSGRTRFERSKFDAAGRMKEFSKRQQYGGGQSTFYDITKITTQFYDGDGERVKEVERGESTQNPAPPGVAQPVITETSKYYVRSTVTGKIITELDSAGGKTTTKVYVGSALLAEQRIYPGTQQIPGWSEVVWQHGDPVTGSIQQTLKSGELAIYVAPRSRRELEPLGGIVPTSDPYYSEEINSPEYNYGGDIFRPEFGCTLPETGQPAPCSVAAALMNYLDGINQTTGNLGNYFRRQAAGRTIPGFIRADNRRDDESEQIPGLRRVERYEGREFVGFMWAVDNSVAAQNVQKETDQQKKQRLLNEAISATRNILASNNSCSNLFGISAVSGFDSMVAVAQLGKLPSDNTGIRQSLTISRYHATKGIRPIIESNSLNGSIPIYPITTPSSFTVNESNSGLFFRSQAYFGYTGVQSRVLQLLHELAHLTVTGFTSEGVEKALKKRGYVQESFLIKSDKGDSAQSDINTKKVLDECKTQIDAIASGGN